MQVKGQFKGFWNCLYKGSRVGLSRAGHQLDDLSSLFLGVVVVVEQVSSLAGPRAILNEEMDPLDEVCCLPNLSTIIKKPTIDNEAGDLLVNSHYDRMENHSIKNNGIFKLCWGKKILPFEEYTCVNNKG